MRHNKNNNAWWLEIFRNLLDRVCQALLLFCTSWNWHYSEHKEEHANASKVWDQFLCLFHRCVFQPPLAHRTILQFTPQMLRWKICLLTGRNSSLTWSIQWSQWPLAESWRIQHSQWYTWHKAARRSLAANTQRNKCCSVDSSSAVS